MSQCRWGGLLLSILMSAVGCGDKKEDETPAPNPVTQIVFATKPSVQTLNECSKWTVETRDKDGAVTKAGASATLSLATTIGQFWGEDTCDKNAWTTVGIREDGTGTFYLVQKGTTTGTATITVSPPSGQTWTAATADVLITQ